VLFPEPIDGTGHTKKVFMAVEDYSRKQDEMEALQFKLQEMDNQKKEFKGFLKCTIAKLEEVSAAKKVDTALNSIYSAFKVECSPRRTETLFFVTMDIISVLYAYIGNAVLSLVHSTLNAE
jgi:hypothetical protein